MPCYFPLVGYRSRDLTSNNKRKIVFNIKYALDDSEITVPCGSCIGCRFERSRQWALRCVHEASLHEENCFITLTYSPDHLPLDHSLDKSHFQKFMKRLRKRFSGTTIRFFHCGEYGELNGRPHYHACIFGFDFPDKVLHTTTRVGDKLYRSKILTKIWGKGDENQQLIGELNFKTAAYTARYIMKKITGDKADEHYRYVDEKTGEVFNIQPEYTTMSRRPGIARDWYEKYKSDVYPSDKVIMNGVSMYPPKFYDSLLEKDNPFLYDDIKFDRLLNVEKYSDDNTPQRLHVKFKVKQAAVKLLSRNYEEL